MFNRYTACLVAVLGVVAAMGIWQVNRADPTADCIIFPMEASNSESGRPQLLVPNPRSLLPCGAYRTGHMYAPPRCEFGTPIDIYMGDMGATSYKCSSDANDIQAYHQKYAGIISGEVDPNTVAPEPVFDPGFPFMCFADERSALRTANQSPKGTMTPTDIPGAHSFCYQVHEQMFDPTDTEEK
jgi:hypothetical protein